MTALYALSLTIFKYYFSLSGPPTRKIHHLSLLDALPIFGRQPAEFVIRDCFAPVADEMEIRREQIVVAQVVHRGDELPRISISDRTSIRLNSSHLVSSYAVFCLQKKHKLSAM